MALWSSSSRTKITCGWHCGCHLDEAFFLLVESVLDEEDVVVGDGVGSVAILGLGMGRNLKGSQSWLNFDLGIMIFVFEFEIVIR